MRLRFTPARRGRHPLPTLLVETHFPLGLFRAWTVWRPAGRVLAWPRPETAPPALPSGATSASDERATRRSSGSELDGVRPWRRGDSMRQVAWKKVARSGELVSRETTGTVQRELWLDWADTHGSDIELRLSRLSAWVLQAEHEGRGDVAEREHPGADGRELHGGEGLAQGDHVAAGVCGVGAARVIDARDIVSDVA
jgi:uncharacterized protein (DUF58 family)